MKEEQEALKCKDALKSMFNKTMWQFEVEFEFSKATIPSWDCRAISEGSHVILGKDIAASKTVFPNLSRFVGRWQGRERGTVPCEWWANTQASQFVQAICANGRHVRLLLVRMELRARSCGLVPNGPQPGTELWPRGLGICFKKWI